MNDKPLGAKAYGSIGHLPNSRLGPGDHKVTDGQSDILTKKPRKGDRVIVQEKLDGACMSVANIDGEIVGLTRAGYRAKHGSYHHLRVFEDYVDQFRNIFGRMLSPGERVVGEWLAIAHGTIYDHKFPTFAPFVAFDVIRDGQRVLHDEFKEIVSGWKLPMRRAFVAHDGPEPMSVLEAMMSLTGPLGDAQSPRGFHGALETIEGAVWRVEREGRVDFLAKYVRPDKVDGKYLPNISGKDPIWMWTPREGWKLSADNDDGIEREAA